MPRRFPFSNEDANKNAKILFEDVILLDMDVKKIEIEMKEEKARLGL